MDNLLGQNLGRYHVIEPLGQGGMASVYKAFDTTLERNVAIKIIRTDKKEGTEQNEFLKRFVREAKALAQLDHPYILKVLDYGEQDGMPYLVMPFVQGGTLKNKMGQPIPYRQAAALLAPIAQALDYAHHRNIIHRDVKPANILITETNAPLLSDFGIAKIIESGESTQLTATGVGIGTPDYMAPEQWLGKTDARTDIYSLGIVFFQMVTGHLPFSADTPAAVLIKHMQDPLPRPKSFIQNLPDAVEQVLFKALAKEPENRFQDMGAFADALGKLAQGDTTSLPASTPTLETVRAVGPAAPASYPSAPVAPVVAAPIKKKKVPGWLIALIVVGIIGVMGLILLITGGAYLAKRLSPLNTLNTSIPAAVGTAKEFATLLPNATSIQPLETLIPPLPNVSGEGTPFTTIEGFPADVPILTNNNGDLMRTTSQGMTMYYFSTNMQIKEVADFFKSGMDSNGWQLMSETSQADMYYWMFVKDDGRQVMISITYDSSSGGPTQVGIIIQQQ
jgi:serine/threonine protein kinase